MVHNGMASGFNGLVWVPNLGLPSFNTLIHGTAPNSWMIDLDIGEIFLNFMLDLDAQKYVGVDGTNIFPEEMS